MPRSEMWTSTHGMIDKKDITGLVLAGGRDGRMGDVDKGLQNHHGVPLAMHALLRLAPQVGAIMINSNHHLGAYEAMGVPVWPDTLPGCSAPLAGFLSGLEHCETQYLVTVACDSPLFPLDLVARLAHALDTEGAELAMAATLDGNMHHAQRLFCLMRSDLLESLSVFTRSGQLEIDSWTARHRCIDVPFDDPGAFASASTVDDLRRRS